MLLAENVQQKEQWLEDRRKGITGTDIAAICGLNKYRSAYDVWLDKRNKSEPIPETPAMKWGRLQEDLIAEYFAEEHGVQLIDPGRYAVMKHPTDDLVIGTPDRLFPNDTELLEVKTGKWAMSKYWGEQGTDDIPRSYLVQVQWYLLLTGRKTGHVAVKLDSSDYREYVVQRNQKLIDNLQKAAHTFWEKNVIGGEVPTVSADERRNIVAAMQDNGTMLEISDPQTTQAAREYNQYDGLEKDYAAKKKEARAKLEAFIGEASGAEGNGFKILWKKNKDSSSVDWEAVARLIATDKKMTEIELQEYVAKHTHVKTGPRVFRFKEVE